MVGKISTLILALNVNDTSVRQLIRVVAPVHPVRLGDGIFNRSCALLRTTAERGEKVDGNTPARVILRVVTSASNAM